MKVVTTSCLPNTPSHAPPSDLFARLPQEIIEDNIIPLLRDTSNRSLAAFASTSRVLRKMSLCTVARAPLTHLKRAAAAEAHPQVAALPPSAVNYAAVRKLNKILAGPTVPLFVPMPYPDCLLFDAAAHVATLDHTVQSLPGGPTAPLAVAHPEAYWALHCMQTSLQKPLTVWEHRQWPGNPLEDLEQFTRAVLGLADGGHGPSGLDAGFLRLNAFPPIWLYSLDVTALTLLGAGPVPIPEELGQLVRLKNLILEDFAATALPDSFAHLIDLQELSLCGSRFNTIPPVLGSFRNLLHLNLSENPLLDCDALQDMEELKSLALHSCDLDEIPPFVFDLKHLRALHLSNNPLTELPPEIGQLRQLVDLKLSMTGIFDFAALSQATGLTDLYLGFNGLEKIPEPVLQLPRLQRLYLDGNHIAHLPDHATGLTQLTHLDLSRNSFTTVPKALGSLHNLVELKFHGNPVEKVTDVFAPMTALEHLDLGKQDSGGMAGQLSFRFSKELGHLQQLQEGLYGRHSTWDLD